MNTISCIIDGAQGIYIPQSFAKNYTHAWHGISKTDRLICAYGPDHRHYWEAWENILNNAIHFDLSREGHTWHLHQDGDLFVYRNDHEFDDS